MSLINSYTGGFRRCSTQKTVCTLPCQEMQVHPYSQDDLTTALRDSTFAAWPARTPAEAAGPKRNHGPRFFHAYAIAWCPKQKFRGLHPFCSSRPLHASAAEGHFPLGGHPYVRNIVPHRRCASQLHRSFPAPLLSVFSFPLHVAISKASGSWAMSSDLTTTPPGRDWSLTCSHPSFTVAAKWNWVN